MNSGFFSRPQWHEGVPTSYTSRSSLMAPLVSMMSQEPNTCSIFQASPAVPDIAINKEELQEGSPG